MDRRLFVLLSVMIALVQDSSSFLHPNHSHTPRTWTRQQHGIVTTPLVLQATGSCSSKEDKKKKNQVVEMPCFDRRQWMIRTTASLVGWTFLSGPAHPLVKGVAPPPPRKVAGEKPKCTNIEECQAEAEKRQREEAEAAAAAAEPVQTTAGGTKYRDVQVGQGRTAKEGDQVTVWYKVLKLGKRSFDGLSGEGTVVFSRGYGLEDDEKVPGDKTFITILGSPNNIIALNEALVGMQPGGVRRFSVFPSKGWRKPGSACDGGPGGSGAGGELRTDYGKSGYREFVAESLCFSDVIFDSVCPPVVVPTATMVQEETCFDTFKQPFPFSYAQQRRMAQRFDQSLIMEVTLVDVADGF